MFAHAETDKGIRRFIRRVGEDLLDDLFELRYSDIIAQGTDRDDTSDKIYQKKVMHIIDSKPPLCERDLAIDGNDIITLLHIPQGREVGRVLKYLLEQVLDNPNLNNREQLIELAIQFYNQNFL